MDVVAFLPHVPVALRAQLLHARLQELALRRAVRFVAGTALAAAGDRVHAGARELLRDRGVALATELHGRALEQRAGVAAVRVMAGQAAAGLGLRVNTR